MNNSKLSRVEQLLLDGNFKPICQECKGIQRVEFDKKKKVFYHDVCGNIVPIRQVIIDRYIQLYHPDIKPKFNRELFMLQRFAEMHRIDWESEHNKTIVQKLLKAI